MATMDGVMKAVIGVVGSVIGLVIIAQVIDSEQGVFGSLTQTVMDYIVPILALVVLSSAATVWKFR